MKFKDNIFYKVVDELKEKSNNFKAKAVEHEIESTKYLYDFDIGVTIVAARLLNLILSKNEDYVEIELDIAVLDYKLKNHYSPNEAFKVLRDTEVDDLVSISFTKDLETRYFNDTFYFYQGQNEIECVSTFYDKQKEEDPQKYDYWDMHDDLN